MDATQIIASGSEATTAPGLEEQKEEGRIIRTSDYQKLRGGTLGLSPRPLRRYCPAGTSGAWGNAVSLL